METNDANGVNPDLQGGVPPGQVCEVAPRQRGGTSRLRRPLVWLGASVALSLAGVATVSAVAHPMNAHGMGDRQAMALSMPTHGGGMGGSIGGSMGGLWMGRGVDRMLDGVNATESQRAQIKQIADAARTDLQAQREAGRALRDRAMNAFTQPNVDAREVETVRQQMLAQHDSASRRMSQAMLDISRVLTPEQRALLAQRMKQRSEQMRQRMEERQRPGAPTT
jgi:periplasmic protein CpxP/Spy